MSLGMERDSHLASDTHTHPFEPQVHMCAELVRRRDHTVGQGRRYKYPDAHHVHLKHRIRHQRQIHVFRCKGKWEAKWNGWWLTHGSFLIELP